MYSSVFFLGGGISFKKTFASTSLLVRPLLQTLAQQPQLSKYLHIKSQIKLRQS